MILTSETTVILPPLILLTPAQAAGCEEPIDKKWHSYRDEVINKNGRA